MLVECYNYSIFDSRKRSFIISTLIFIICPLTTIPGIFTLKKPPTDQFYSKINGLLASVGCINYTPIGYTIYKVIFSIHLYGTLLFYILLCLGVFAHLLRHRQRIAPNHTSLQNIRLILRNHRDFFIPLSKGEYDKALECFEKAVNIQVNSLARYHPMLAATYSNIGSIYKEEGEYDKALEYFEKELEVELMSLPSNHPSLVTTYANIGSLYSEKDDDDKALEYYTKGLEVELKSTEPLHPSVGIACVNIGSLYKENGVYDKGLEYYETGLRIFLDSLPPHNPLLATVYCKFGLIYDEIGEYDKAL
ncbi:unnamed protein product [Rotaria sordida]|nr:unnamed protein product [Rotaria sordida]